MTSATDSRNSTLTPPGVPGALILPGGDAAAMDAARSGRRFAWGSALVVFGVLVLSLVVERPIHAFMEIFILNLRSEYKVPEQLSKLYLLVTLLVAAAQLTLVRERGGGLWERLAPAGLVMLAITMYLSESDMIHESAQPPIGLALGLAVGIALLAQRRVAALAWIGAGGAVVALGVALDLLSMVPPYTYPEGVPNPAELAGLPEWLFWSIMWVIRAEERVDVLGLCLLALGTLLACREAVLQQLQRLPMGWIGVGVLGAVLLAGNGSILHWKEQPSPNFYMGAIPGAMAGIGLLLLWNRRLTRAGAAVGFGPAGPAGLTLVLVFLGVVLPVSYGMRSGLTSLLMWLPVLLAGLPFLVWGDAASPADSPAGRHRPSSAA